MGFGSSIVDKNLPNFKIQNYKKTSHLALLIIVLAVSLALILPVQSAAAASISFAAKNPDTGVITNPVVQYAPNDIAIITVDDHTNPAFTTNNKIDTITVTISSVDSFANPVDNTQLTLTETGSNTGIFKNTALIFSPHHTQYSVNSVITVNQTENDGIASNCLGGGTIGATKIDIVCVSVKSTTSTSGIPSMTLTETGLDTQTFVGNLKLVPPNYVGGSNSITVNPGDVLSINYLGSVENAVIAPLPTGVGELLVTPFDGVDLPADTVTVTYGVTSSSIDIDPEAGGGGGGGGVLRPGLVLDFLYQLFQGGSPFIVAPPSFGGSGGLHYSDGLTIVKPSERYVFDISKYNQDIQDQVLVAGQSVNMTLKMYDGYNINGIIHSGLYLIPSGSDMITPNSIASIVYDKHSKLEINDPTKLFSDASASSSNDGKFQYFSFHFIPTRSYEKMSFLDKSWNDHRYSTDVIFHDAAISKPETNVLPTGFTKYDNYKDMITLIENNGFKKPLIMSHIHDAVNVFPANVGGHVCWLYNSILNDVTLVISDDAGNTLYSFTELLTKNEIQPKGDYGFMKFTVTQLNRMDVEGEREAMEQEAVKALGKLMMTEGYHQENGVWLK